MPRKQPLLFPEFKPDTAPNSSLEIKYREMGFARVAGADEVGRGPLAGPVVAACVTLPPDLPSSHPLQKVRDSKLLSHEQRVHLYQVIAEEAEDVAWAMCDPAEIDRMNILAASLEAMRRAAFDLDPIPNLVLVDGNQGLPGPIPSAPVIKGDRICLSIAAASIVAKVIRDQIMEGWHRRYPEYGFGLHKGYPTPEHKAALLAHGPCPIHRRSFRGVRELLERE